MTFKILQKCFCSSECNSPFLTQPRIPLDFPDCLYLNVFLHISINIFPIWNLLKQTEKLHVFFYFYCLVKCRVQNTHTRTHAHTNTLPLQVIFKPKTLKYMMCNWFLWRGQCWHLHRGRAFVHWPATAWPHTNGTLITIKAFVQLWERRWQTIHEMKLYTMLKN